MNVLREKRNGNIIFTPTENTTDSLKTKNKKLIKLTKTH